MVTVNNDYYPNYTRAWEPTRPMPEPTTEPTPAPVQNESSLGTLEKNPPMTITSMLREHCHVPYESFFLAAHLGGGKFAYFAGPNSITEDNIRKMFRREKFLMFQNRTTGGSFSETHEDDYDLNESYAGRNAMHYDDRVPSEPRSRKRPRRQGALRRDHDDDAPPVITSSKVPIEIGNSQAVWDFYEHRFKCIQQNACKEIAKAFVKIIAPKKQANHPYTRGEATAPDWWPKPWGPGEKDKARHVEPDHQWKKERVYVLSHILRLIVDPETRPPSIQRLGVITVAKMETAAMDSLAGFFNDPHRPKNAKKRAILKELFKVAKMEEKYKRNEIDATTQVFVTADDMVMDFCFDEDEQNDDDEGGFTGIEAEQPRPDPVTSAHVSPARTTSMPMLPSVSPTTSAVQALSTQFQTTPFMNDLPVRTSQYAASAMLPADLAAEQYAYSDSNSLAATGTLQSHATASLQLHDLLTASPHQHHPDTSRRSSFYTPATAEYALPSPSAVYNWAQAQSQSPQVSHPQATAATPTSTADVSLEPTSSSSALFAYPSASAAAAHQGVSTTAALPPLPLALPMPIPHASQQPLQHQQQPANPHTASQYLQVFDGLPATTHSHHHHQQQCHHPQSQVQHAHHQSQAQQVQQAHHQSQAQQVQQVQHHETQQAPHQVQQTHRHPLPAHRPAQQQHHAQQQQQQQQLVFRAGNIQLSMQQDHEGYGGGVGRGHGHGQGQGHGHNQGLGYGHRYRQRRMS